MKSVHSLTPVEIEKLLGHARLAAASAYAPYSKFLVGAAILTASQQFVTGCNIENASYGLTLCAERVTAASAIAAEIRDWRAIAVVSPTGVFPCGACRQFLAEFKLDLEVIIGHLAPSSPWQSVSLNQLLPNAMRLDEMR